MYKNVASQKIAIYAHDTAADAPKTGDAANITAQISKDGAACAATNDTNPTELDAADAPGVYIFDMLQAETNADLIVLSAVSSTADIQIEPVIIYTVPTVAEIATAIMAKIVDGTLDVTETLKVLLAVLGGDVTKSGNTYTFKDQSGATKISWTVGETSTDRTIA